MSNSIIDDFLNDDKWKWMNGMKFELRDIVSFHADKQTKGKVSSEMKKFSKEQVPLLIIDARFKDGSIFYQCVRNDDKPEGSSKKWYQEDALEKYTS